MGSNTKEFQHQIVGSKTSGSILKKRYPSSVSYITFHQGLAKTIADVVILFVNFAIKRLVGTHWNCLNKIYEYSLYLEVRYIYSACVRVFLRLHKNLSDQDIRMTRCIIFFHQLRYGIWQN